MKLSSLFPSHRFAIDPEITGLTADSRKVQPGFLFAALPGTHVDGRKFIPAAVQSGAAAVLMANDHLMQVGVPSVATANPRRELAMAAARFYDPQPKHVVAITGTNGKSSTVDFLRQIWTHAGRKAASMGTLGAIGPGGHIDLGHTTPDPVAIHATLATLRDQGVTHVAMEASSHGLDQSRLDAVHLSGGAFTNLTQDHLDYHPTFEDYARAKLRLFRDLLPQGAPAIVNADAAESLRFETAARAAGLNTLTCGWRGDYLRIGEIWPRPAGQRVDLRFAGQSRFVDLPLIGEFQALNAVTAAALALAFGESFDAVCDALQQLQPVKGRMEYVGATTNGAHVFVDYAHTPDGLDVLLRAVRPHTPGRIILVFGCGGDRDRTKRPIMGEIAGRLADTVIVTDDNPRTEVPATIRQAILAACRNGLEIGDRADAIQTGVRMLMPGDALVIAGKGHETGQLIGDVTLPFSDQETALFALRDPAA